MRIKLTLSSDRGFISLPVHHNKHIQSLLYSRLPKFLSNFLHNSGFVYDGKRFKMFTFSKIISEKFHLKDGRFYYKSPITLYISSAVDEVVQLWKKNLESRSFIKLEKSKMIVESVEEIPKPEFYRTVRIKTLSPITVYRTEDLQEGRKYTRYFSPENSQEFENLIKQNIQRKYFVLTGIKPPEFEFKISLLKLHRRVPVKYMDTFIEGYEGEFEINIDKTYILEKVYDSGLGSKNSQGFGMVEIIG